MGRIRLKYPHEKSSEIIFQFDEKLGKPNVSVVYPGLNLGGGLCILKGVWGVEYSLREEGSGGLPLVKVLKLLTSSEAF